MHFDQGYGNIWTDVYVNYREGYFTSVTDYHKHEFYEINLILTGNVKIILEHRFYEGSENRIVMTAPGTPHYISCKPDTLYSRLYLVFSKDFIEKAHPEWQNIVSVIGKGGTVLSLTSEETEMLSSLIEDIGKQNDTLSKQLLLCYFLLCVSRCSKGQTKSKNTNMPSYMISALNYIENHYSEKLVAEDIAKKLYVGRTTLMTEFKKHLGKTVGEYITDCRLKNAVRMLERGDTIEQVAERCGFSDSSGLMRAFKRRYNTTPRKYIQENAGNSSMSWLHSL